MVAKRAKHETTWSAIDAARAYDWDVTGGSEDFDQLFGRGEVAAHLGHEERSTPRELDASQQHAQPALRHV
eukprot:1020177-Pleurochrysis_carterae.AAC.1